MCEDCKAAVPEKKDPLPSKDAQSGSRCVGVCVSFYSEGLAYFFIEILPPSHLIQSHTHTRAPATPPKTPFDPMQSARAFRSID